MKTIVFPGAVLLMVSCGSPEAKEKDASKEQSTEVSDSTSLEDTTQIDVDVSQEPHEVLILEDFEQFSSHEDLVEHFGEENLKKTEAWKAEGTVRYTVSVVYPDSKHPLHVFWNPEGKGYTDITMVEQYGILYDENYTKLGMAEPYWKNNAGLEINMGLEELEEIIGPFEFFGLGWDYGGAVSNKSDKINNYTLRLDYIQEEGEGMPDNYSKILGDKLLRSDNEAARSLGLKLVTITYSFE